MKIKRLTAGLAVAAMAATFFVASPMVSAQAKPLDQPTGLTPATYKTPDAITTDLVLSVPGGQSTSIPVASLLNGKNVTQQINSVSGNWRAFNQVYQGVTGVGASINVVSAWPCLQGNSGVVDPNSTRPAAGKAPTLMTDGTWGTISCNADGNLVYNPALTMGVNGDVNILVYYELVGIVDPNDPLNISYTPAYSPWISGYINLTVTYPEDSSACAYDNATGAGCQVGDMQAFGKKDDPTSAKIDVISPNVKSADGKTGFVTGDGNWGIVSIDSASSVDNALKTADLMKWVTYGTGRGANTIKMTLPQSMANWSGTISYGFVLASFNCGSDGVSVGTTTACKASYHYGLATFVVHPTLTAPDDLTTDQGVAVTIPLLGANALPIIGTAPFQDASCTFADTKAKTTLSGVGSIKNPGGSKNPVFTPVADFVGDVTLTCTVADKWDPISNPVDVVIHVGTPAPAPVAPATTPAPACDNANGKCVLSVTGGSLAAPMSSGLAAVVLLVAAGAGILVVRRRTALAG